MENGRKQKWRQGRNEQGQKWEGSEGEEQRERQVDIFWMRMVGSVLLPFLTSEFEQEIFSECHALKSLSVEKRTTRRC